MRILIAVNQKLFVFSSSNHETNFVNLSHYHNIYNVRHIKMHFKIMTVLLLNNVIVLSWWKYTIWRRLFQSTPPFNKNENNFFLIIILSFTLPSSLIDKFHAVFTLFHLALCIWTTPITKRNVSCILQIKVITLASTSYQHKIRIRIL